MMNTMAALGMASIFSFWVWSLKHEIAELQRKMSTLPAGSPHAVSPKTHTRRSGDPSNPIWTIE